MTRTCKQCHGETGYWAGEWRDTWIDCQECKMVGNSYILETEKGVTGFRILSKVGQFGYKYVRVYVGFDGGFELNQEVGHFNPNGKIQCSIGAIASLIEDVRHFALEIL